MDTLDYYNNADIRATMAREMAHIKNREDREDCEQEIFAELYDFMPLDTEEAKRIVKRVAEKIKRGAARINEHEMPLVERL